MNYSIDLSTDAGWLDLLSRKTFHAGFSRSIVDSRWSGMREAFRGFEPPAVAQMEDAELEALARDPLLIRNRAKLWAVRDNARHFCAVARDHKAWAHWLRSLDALPYEQREQTLVSCLHRVGPTTLFWFLYEAGLVDLNDRPEYVKPQSETG